MKLIIGIVIGILLDKFWTKIVEAEKKFEEVLDRNVK